MLKAGKAPIEAFTIYEKSNYESPMAGDAYSKGFTPALTIFLPQPSVNNVATLSILKNSRCLVLFRRPIVGSKFLQIGSKQIAAKIREGSVKFGQAQGGEPGVTFIMESFDIHPFYAYNAELPAAAGG